MEQLRVAADIDMAHVPYRGIGPAITDIQRGSHKLFCHPIAAERPSRTHSGRDIPPILVRQLAKDIGASGRWPFADS